MLLAGALLQALNPLHEGLIALRDGKLAEAKVSFEQVIQNQPENAIAWVSLAEVNRRLGDKSDANEAAKKAEQFGRNLPAIEHALASFYMNQGEFGIAARLEEKYAAKQGDEQASLRTAELYQRAGDEPNAERILKQTGQKRPADAQVAFSYAQLLLHKLDFMGAEKAVTAAQAAHPRDPQLILVVGVARYGERRFADAIDRFLSVIAIDPAISQPYDFLGRMLEQAGPKLPEIREAFERRVKTVPDDSLATLVLAKARLLSDPKDAQAEELLRHSITIAPAEWEAHYELGLVLESKRDFPAAEGELKRSIELDSKQPMPHYHLARVYDRLGEAEHAAEERKVHAALTNQ